VRLLVAQHLEAMLDVAQENIGFVQLRPRGFIDPAFFTQSGQHRPSLAPAQRAVAPAGNELLRLDEELDLPDAAAASLDVVPEHLHGGMAVMRMDLSLDRMHVGDGCEVEIFAPDERGELGQESLAGRKVAGAGPALMRAARSQFWPMLS
jgi:hypothetical protein